MIIMYDERMSDWVLTWNEKRTISTRLRWNETLPYTSDAEPDRISSC